MSITNTEILGLYPKADKSITVCGEKWRITVITDRLIRLEYSDSGRFEDRATRFAANRNFARTEFKTYSENGKINIVTPRLHIIYDGKPFSSSGLRIILNGTNDWVYGTEEEPLFKNENLGGTVRTLDNADGAVELDKGLLSKCNAFSSGYTVIDDSQTIAIEDDGWPVPVSGGRTDIYFFGYMREYEDCIRDFYKLSGASPILPRYALGNWWSRFHRYSDEEYRNLLKTFKAHNVPLSVGILDMDWHITETPDAQRYGSGWTGYTFNKELFPDYKDTMKYVRDCGLKLSLNLHPKDGIRAFEDCYPAMCRRMGLDEKEKKAIEFNVSDRKFMEAYFDTVLNPYEEDGVDLWWIDWQQSDHTAAAGYDTLWMLNYCHYLDSARNGKPPLTLSRYAGLGSHRFPLGFSGDTATTWASLDFQPYFTATAANAGYSWWSHDIGGHATGTEDDELYIRWVQFGVFSPIMRLHCSASEFMDKAPWSKRAEIESIAEDFLRLRHKLVPYIFTMMYRNHDEGIPMIRPLYHKYNNCPQAFLRKNEYFFGDSIIVSPITSKGDLASRLGSAVTWLPEGTYIDFFSGRVYNGSKTFRACRDLESIPVFVKAGSVIPMAGDVSRNGVDNPEKIELHVFGGDDGSFCMVEDNGRIDGKRQVSKTLYEFKYGRHSTLKFTAPKAIETVPAKRIYTVVFTAFTEPLGISVTVGGREISLSSEYDELHREIRLGEFEVIQGQSVSITVETSGKLPENEIEKTAFDILKKAQVEFHEKDSLYRSVMSDRDNAEKIAEICAFDGNLYLEKGPYDGNRTLCSALIELLSADK